MIKNYLKIAFRNMFRSKIHSFINIAGLGIGISCCVLIGLYVINEESYDGFNKNADRIVRATTVYSIHGTRNEIAVTGTKLLPAFEQNFPEVESGVRLYRTRAIVKSQNQVFDEPRVAYADSTFFKVFSFKLLQGDPARCLVRPYSVILTVTTARKYFGDENPIGRVIRMNTRINLTVGWNDYTVTGVMQDCPPNSQIKFDFLASFSSLPVAKPGSESWLEADYYTYFLLRTPQSIMGLQAKIPAYMKTQYKEIGITGNDYLTFHLQPLQQVHLYSAATGDLEPPGDYRYVVLFSMVAFLILGIACANYVNLTTAKFSERAREVGVRKVIGAYRRQLTYQFMGESFIVVLFALIFGLMLAELFLPTFNSISGKQLEFSYSQLTEVVATIAVIGLIASLLGGVYPSLVLSRFQPIKTLKGNFKTANSGLRIRKALIVVQFVISVGLVISALIIRGQMNYILNANLGFDKDHVAALPMDDSIVGKTDALKSEFLNDSHITGVTFATRTPVSVDSRGNVQYNNGKIIVGQLGIDQDFLKTLGVQLVSGSNFTSADTFSFLAAVPADGVPIMVNETAVSKLDLTPRDAIGKMIVWNGRNCRIKGVIKDFRFSSMRELIDPLVLFPHGYLNEMMVRLSGGEIRQTVDYMREKWDAVVPDHPFELTFLNDEFNKLYVSESRTEHLFYVFAILAIGLAGLGLFGLVAFGVQERTKEIGIRKTLGARPADVVFLLSKDYLTLAVLSTIIAAPIAWYVGHKWLEGFAYRTEINAWIFVLTAISAIALVLVTVGIHAIRAATANPVEALRYE
jgi:putative ABC transport system permease protein